MSAAFGYQRKRGFHMSDATNVQDPKKKPVDVENLKMTVHLARPAPGEEDAIFVSNGRENVTVKKGMAVEVPYWVYIRLRQMEDAQIEAAAYENWSSKVAARG